MASMGSFSSNDDSSLPGEIDQMYLTLSQAIRSTDVETIKSLLGPIRNTPKCCKLLSKTSRCGRYPLHLACQDKTVAKTKMSSRLRVVEAIVDSIGKDKRLMHFLHADSMYGHTALHTAAVLQEADVVKILLDSLSSHDRLQLIDAEDGNKKVVLDYDLTTDIRQLIEGYKRPGRSRETVIEEATDGGVDDADFVILDSLDGMETTTQLLNLNNDVGREMVAWPLTNNENSTANSQVEKRYITPTEAFEMFEDVLKQVRFAESFDILLEDKMKNEKGMTILHILVVFKRCDLILNLLTSLQPSEGHWRLITHQCASGKTALHYACVTGSHNIVNLLIHHCDLSLERRWELILMACCCGQTSLHYASRVGSIDVVETLLKESREHDIDLVEIEDSHGNSAKAYATSSDIKQLLTNAEIYFWRIFYHPPTALIFYNKFENYMGLSREGAEEEKDNMVKTFKNLGIDPVVVCGFNEHTIKHRIASEVDKTAGNISAFFVVVMSHGSEGIVCDENYGEIKLQKIIEYMSYNPYLEFVPKVLFLQSCLHDRNHSVNRASTRRHLDVEIANGISGSYNNNAYYMLCSEFCLITSTLQKMVSIRGLFAGSIQRCSKRNEACLGELSKLLQATSRQMKKCRQTLETRSTLTRDIRLTPPPANKSTFHKIKELFTQ